MTYWQKLCNKIDMEKLLSIIVLGLLLSGNANAYEPPSYDKISLNVNILTHEWSVKSSIMSNSSPLHIEIYTLTKNNWILKCTLIYNSADQSGYCNLP